MSESIVDGLIRDAVQRRLSNVKTPLQGYASVVHTGRSFDGEFYVRSTHNDRVAWSADDVEATRWRIAQTHSSHEAVEAVRRLIESSVMQHQVYWHSQLWC